VNATHREALAELALTGLRQLPPTLIGGSEEPADDGAVNDALDHLRDVVGDLAPVARADVLHQARSELARVRPHWTEDERRTAIATLTREAVTPATSGAPPITWLDTSSIFADLPATPWVSRGLMLAPGRPALLAGYGASAKTLAAQSLALSVAAGRPIWSFFEVGDPGRVLHLDYEQGEHASRRRYQRLAIGHGIDAPELGDRLRLAALPRVYLDAVDAADIFARELDGSQLAIIDSLRAAAPTLDENASDVRRALDALTTASVKTGCAVLVIHHAGKAQDRHADARQVVRGSSAIFDAAGCALIIAAGKTKTDPRRVTQAKVPAEAEGAPIDDFGLAVEDVALAGDPTAGVRVLHRSIADANDVQGEVDARLERDAGRVLDAVRQNPDTTITVLRAKAGLANARVAEVLAVLEHQRRVVASPADRGGKRYRLILEGT
jgi:hypothetical protein